MSGLEISLLGPFSAALDGRILKGFRTRLAQALLIYLACEPERHGREQLMALLWPGLPQASAQQNLRQNLYLLRQALPAIANRNGGAPLPFVLASRETIQLNPDAVVVVDAVRLATLLDLIRPNREQLQEAAALYRGNFLDSFYLPDSNPYEEWATARREALRRGVLSALERLTAMAVADSDYAAAEGYARRQLTIDPLHETANRQLIEVLARSGRRVAALSHFEIYERLLHSDLDVPPGTETLSLVEHVRAGRLEPTGEWPDHIRGYDILEELGGGSFSTVYRVCHRAVQREVAIKAISAHYANDADFIRRFESEAQVIARLEHPHVVPLYDYWREPGNAFLVMRYLRGGDLKTALRAGGWPVERVAQLLEQMASALQAAHRHGIVHCDVKPANILLDEEGSAYLADFGIAQLLGASAKGQASDLFAGTPDYLSPEQAQLQSLTPLSDQYSLGLVAYEALTGRPPFESNSLLELLQKHIHEPLPSVRERQPEVPAAVDHVLHRATAKEPADRFPDMVAFAHAFLLAAHPQAADLASFAPLLDTINPYKGLLAFTEADEALFYGRETLAQKLLNRLADAGEEAHRFLAIVGPSGSGKSSLVKAALVPALRRGALPGSERWYVLDVTPGTDPFDEVASALLRIAVNRPAELQESLRAGKDGLLRATRQALPAATGYELVLVIDQFEELFTQVADPSVTTRFLDALYTAVMEPDSLLRVIVTLRADFYDRPLLYPGLSELVQQRTEVVVPLTPDELVRAIERPAARAGISVEPELVAALVADVNAQPGALPLLQYTLSELFERRTGEWLTLNAYRELNGIDGALARRAEEVYAQLDVTGQAAARALFSRLVALGDGVETCRRVLRTEVEALAMPDNGQHDAPAPPSPIFSRLLEAYGRARLLSFDHSPITRGPTVEIAHEALLSAWPRLRGWLDEDQVVLRLSRLLTQAAVEWQESGRDEGFLLRGSRLDQLTPLAHAPILLTDVERAYLDDSLTARRARRATEEARRQRELDTARHLAETEKARATAEQQRAEEQMRAAANQRRRSAILAVALAVAGVFAALAIGFARTSARNAQVALARELSLAATNTLAADPELSTLLALQALDTLEIDQAQEALHQAIQSSRTLLAFDAGATGNNLVLLALSPDGTRAATADGENVHIWDTNTGALSQSLPLAVPTTKHYDLIYDGDGGGLALLSANEARDHLTVQTWNLTAEGTTTARTFPLSLEAASDVALSPDWQLLAVSYKNGTVEMWAAATDRPPLALDNHSDSVVDLAFSPSGDRLATASPMGEVIIWDVPGSLDAGTGRRAATVAAQSRLASNGNVTKVTFAGEDSLILSYLGEVEVWGLANPDGPSLTPLGDTKLSTVQATNPDQTRLATAGQDGVTRIWDMTTGEELLVLARHTAPVNGAAFTPDGRRLVTVDRAGNLRVWDVRPQLLGEQTTLSVDAGVFDVALSPDEKQMALGSVTGAASLWDLASGQRLHTFGGGGPVYRVAYSPDGEQLATVGSDNQIRIWDVESGQELLTFSGHGGGVASGLFPGTLDVAYSPDGDRLVTAGADGVAKVWDASTGEELLALQGQEGGLLSVAYSSDGRFIATTNDQPESTIKVWDAQTGAEVHTLGGHPAHIWGVAFSPDSATLVTGGARGVIKAWDVVTGQELYTVSDHSDDVGTIVFTPDGEYFFSTGSVPLRLRRLADGAEILTLASPFLWSADLTQDGRWLYAADVDGVVRVLAVRLEDARALAHDRLTRWWQPDECRTYLHADDCPPAPARFSSDE